MKTNLFWLVSLALLFTDSNAWGQTLAGGIPRSTPANGSYGASGKPSNLLAWAPPDVDEAVPAVAPEVSCSLPEVLRAAGQRVQELVTNLEQFSANERIEHRELEKDGRWGPPKMRSFEYLVTIQQHRAGWLWVEETRNSSRALDGFPTQLATTGLAALALIFHPSSLAEYEMACEGLGQWEALPAWQVRFQQRPDQPNRTMSFRTKGRKFREDLKGRAWIAADSCQIVRLEMDLVTPIPEIRLQTSHMVIEYRPVEFRQRKLQLWLPTSADLYLDFRGRRYHHRHSFANFVLFSVDVAQQVYDPKQP